MNRLQCVRVSAWLPERRRGRVGERGVEGLYSKGCSCLVGLAALIVAAGPWYSAEGAERGQVTCTPAPRRPPELSSVPAPIGRCILLLTPHLLTSPARKITADALWRARGK